MTHADTTPGQPGGSGWVALDQAWDGLRPRGLPAPPKLVEAYRAGRSWEARATVVSHATRYARQSEPAYQLGLEALTDRSAQVRRHACGLLAYSLRRDAIRRLQPLLAHSDPMTRADAGASIAAILAQDHHLFKDRDFSGQIFWIVCERDLEELWATAAAPDLGTTGK